MRPRYAALLLGIIALACAAQLSDAAGATGRPSYTVHRALVKLRNAPSASSAIMVPAGAVSPEWIDLASRTQVTIWTARRLVGGLHVIELEPQGAGEPLEQSLARLRADPAVEYAEADQRRRPMSVPDDPLYFATPGATGQWYLQAPISTPAASATPSAVDAEDAWTITTGSTGLVIADIDTGVRFDHPDLLRAGDTDPGRLLPGYDFVSDVTAGNESNGPNADASDPGDWVTQADTQTSEFSGCTVGNSSWHGTRVSGVLGALSNNHLGITGTTWLGWQLPVRALGKCGGSDSDIETAMLWAAGVPQSGFPTNPYPARILNMSLGGTASCSQSTCPQTSCPQSYQTIISELAQMGVLVVASAGNSGGPVATPGNCSGVVAVAGLREDGTKVGYSNLGTGVSLSAPAGNCVNTSGACLYSIDTTYNIGLTTPEANSYTNQTNTNLGTSFSAPIVSGIAGLMVSVNANLTPAQLLARLQEGAITPFPVSSDSTVPTCHVPTSDNDYSQDAECNCTTATCGVGMANALGAVNAALRPIAAVTLPAGGVSAGQSVVLSATGSAAACNGLLSSYSWTITSGTGTIVSGASSSTVTVQAPASGAASFAVTLTVTDDSGKIDSANVIVGPTSATTSAPSSAGGTPCLNTITPVAPSYVTVAPSGPSVQAGQGTQAFTATVVNAASSAVIWEVNGVSGGSATTGTISSAGLYTAPVNVPSSPTVTVTAVSSANSGISGFAGVTITSPVSVAIAPSSANVLVATGTQNFTATVSNSSNTAVTWQVNGIPGGNATVGTISSSGLYTAPAVIPTPATVTVSAVSVASPTQSASAVVSVVHVVVGVTPTSITLGVLNTQTFTAAVTNTTNIAVTWQVNGIPGGNATVGTISSAGVYTAPAAIPTSPSVTVSAVSVADPTRSGQATVTISQVTVSIIPTTTIVVAGATQSFTATVLYTSNSTVTWEVNGIVGGNAAIGTVSTSGVYTAPLSVPSPPGVTVTAISAASPGQSASASVAIVAASSASSSSGGSSGSSSSGGSSSGGSSASSSSSGGGGHSGGGALDVWSLLALSGVLALRRSGRPRTRATLKP